jgi:hypothetical protein
MDSYHLIHALEMARKTRSGRDMLEERQSLEVRADITTRDHERGDPSMKKVCARVLPGPDAGSKAARSGVTPYGPIEAGCGQRRNGSHHQDGTTLLPVQEEGRNPSSLWPLSDAAAARDQLTSIEQLQIPDIFRGFPAQASIKPSCLVPTLKGQTYWFDSFYSGVLSDAGLLPQETSTRKSA